MIPPDERGRGRRNAASLPDRHFQSQPVWRSALPTIVGVDIARGHLLVNAPKLSDTATAQRSEHPVTHGPGGRILTNAGVWSHDSRWIVYDTRSDPAGEVFDGRRIEMVNVDTGEVRVLYESARGAHCGVATFHPRLSQVIFILGPENPTPDWSYNAWHRQGVMVEVDQPGRHIPLEARDIVPPFTPGALRGGSHVHLWDAAGDWVSFTYEDHVLAARTADNDGADPNQRNVGVSIPGRAVRVPVTHPRNHDGSYFSVLVTRTKARPEPGSDEISRAFEEAWIGTNGYARADGSRQRRALAFQGAVTILRGLIVAEVFVADLPDDLTVAGEGPLEGTELRRPTPPRGVTQRRLTFTSEWKHAGLQGPRHWLRSSPDGGAIAFLARDDAGVVQLWTISPNGGVPRQVTRGPHDVASAFTWDPTGRRIAHVMDRSVCVTDVESSETLRLTPPVGGDSSVRPEACVFSPDGQQIAFVRRDQDAANQIWIVEAPGRP